MSSTIYHVTLGERVMRIELRTDGERILARIDGGAERPVRLDAIHGVLHSFTLGAQQYELLASATEEGVALSIGGHEYRAEVLDDAHARLASVAGGRAAGHVRRELKAPMPGLLVKVLCQPGDQVEAGQPLAVLQAMKMENELSLPRGGTVLTVAAEAGQTVEQGQVLVVVE
jgi:propionyl-CoA carboxylase alpha chain